MAVGGTSRTQPFSWKTSLKVCAKSRSSAKSSRKLLSSANFFLGAGAAINNLHASFEKFGTLLFRQAVGFMANLGSQLTPPGLVRVVEVPGLCLNLGW